MAASCLGAKLPDIDTKTSTISHKNRIISFFLRIFTEHRGITHTPFLLSIFCVYLNSFAIRINQLWINSIVVGFTIGYMSHLVYDMLNPRGIPLLYPVMKKKFHLARITTGSFSERLFYLVNIILFLVMCFKFVNTNIYNIDFLLKKL